MREHNAQYLLVLDKNLQVVGVVTIAIFNRQSAGGAPTAGNPPLKPMLSAT